MTDDEQRTICMEIAKACMWGQEGIACVILEKLQAALPMAEPWEVVYRKNTREARYQAVGVIRDEAELRKWLSRGYWLCNYQPGQLSLNNPPPMNGLAMYVVGELAEEYGKRHDAWNYGIYERERAAHSAGEKPPCA
jgi:hypothetical protein